MHPPPLKNGDKEKGAGELTLDVSAPSKEIWQTDAISQSVHHVHRNLFYLAATKTFDRYAISKLSHLGLSFAELLVAYRYLSSQVRYFKVGFLAP